MPFIVTSRQRGLSTASRADIKGFGRRHAARRKTVRLRLQRQETIRKFDDGIRGIAQGPGHVPSGRSHRPGLTISPHPSAGHPQAIRKLQEEGNEAETETQTETQPTDTRTSPRQGLRTASSATRCPNTPFEPRSPNIDGPKPAIETRSPVLDRHKQALRARSCDVRVQKRVIETRSPLVDGAHPVIEAQVPCSALSGHAIEAQLFS